MTCSKSTVKATGLNIWCSGEQDNHEPEVDVIAVQGLGAHPYYTWVRKQDFTGGARSRHRRPFDLLPGRSRNAQVEGITDTTQTTSEPAQTASKPAETMWLRDLLPSLIPHARIATYSYESDWRKAEVKTSLRRCGQQLLNILHQNRSSEKECRRPLVFIGHSLGGLVIKQALVLANHGDLFRNIRSSTAGIIFLGAPHQGSDAAVYGLWLSQALGHDKTLLESLKRNSSSLYEIAQDFESSYRGVDVVCFYENKEASYGPWRTQFVDQQSATLPGKRMIYLTTDHSGLNKFHGPEDKNFCLVYPEIQRMVKSAPTIMEARYRSHPVINEDFRIDFSLRGIPIVRNFVARDAEMNRLRQELLPALTNEMRRKVFVLHGLGGIGKTQLSVEFARKYHTSFSAVFWIDGSTMERLKRSIADLARRLPQDQLSESAKSYLQEKSSDIDEVVNEVLNWFSQPLNNQWLLVFDNVDREFSALSQDSEAFDVKKYFPEADQGSILLTSRLASLRQLGSDLKLNAVDELQGERILKNSLGEAVEGLSELVKLLQGLPLAINQAGSYMQETGTSVADYMNLYDRAWRKLMTLQDDADHSVLTTWTLSFNHLRAKSKEAANLLLLWAFLDNQDLWYELLAPTLDQDIFNDIPDWFVKCAGDELDFKECMRLLLRYSFIDVKSETSSFSIHPVFHHWCFHAFGEDKAVLSRLATIIVASAAPSKTIPHYTITQRRLLPHCDCIFSLAQQRMEEASINEMDLQWQSDAYHILGYVYSDQTRMKEAEAMYLRALAGKEKAWGAEHSKTLDTVNNLGILYSDEGKMKEAEAMYLRALAGREKAWGAEHSETLDTVNNLGNLYSNQGKMKEAEAMYLRALAGKEKAWGAEHTSTLDTVNNLGNLYSDQGKMKEAEAMYLRALAGFEKAWGAEHTSTLETVNNLGVLYQNQDKMEEAEAMYLRALAGREKAWGAEHSKTLDTVNNLGSLYSDQGKMKEAEAMYLRALAGKEKAWGAEHTSTLETVNNMGVLYWNQGKMKEAEAMYLRALAGKEKAWGAEHTSTLDTVGNLGILYSDEGKMKEAEAMYLRALAGFEKAWGAEHTSTLRTVNNLAAMYSDQGKIEEAEAMYLRALAGKEKAWGAKHTSTLDTVYNLGILYKNQGKMEEAEAMYLRALAGYEKALGAEHTSTLKTMNNLAIMYSNQGRIEEAEAMYLRALAGFEKAWGAEHTSTLNTVNNLGNLYQNQGKMEEAEAMYLRALAGFEKARRAEHTSTLNTVNNLGTLYRNQGKMEEAEAMYLRALAGYEKAWGAEHSETLDTVNNLGILYKNQGKIEEAELMYLRALAGYEKAWGAEHKKPLDVRYNMANLYEKKGQYKDAIEQFELVVQGYTNVLGPDHWETVDASQRLSRCAKSSHGGKTTRRVLAKVSGWRDRGRNVFSSKD